MAAILKAGAFRITQRSAAYALALTLPFVSFIITLQLPELHSFPLALHFLSIAMVATLGGFGPALTAVALALGTRYVYLYRTSTAPVGWEMEGLRAAVLLGLALIICVVSRRRRISEARLEVAVQDLQERTEALAATLNSSKCASWVLDMESGQSARWFEGSFPIFGRPFSEIEPLPSLITLLHPEDQPQLLGLVQHMRGSMEPVVHEYRTQWPNGEVHWLEMRGTRIPGVGPRWRGVTLDITERKRSEAALLRSEKLGAMGRLASTVAHKINNPLEAVTNLLYLANSDKEISSETRSYISSAETELARLGNITRLTLGFVRNSGLATAVDLAATVDDVLAVFQNRLETRGIVVVRHYELEVGVSMPLHELRQVATNLISNAADACGRTAPSITIRVQRLGRTAVLLVEDNGEGIAPGNLTRVFEPFYSTREEVGTGIGLWVTREIVEKNGGSISVESGRFAAGIRTRFRTELPITLPPVTA